MNSYKILIVDDEIEYSSILKKILKRNGYNVTTAQSGKEALLKIKHNRFNLVLTDLIMEGMNGIELLERIKDFSDTSEVILITGYGTVKNAVEAMKKGAFSYFIKGNDTEELLLEIKKAYEMHSLKNENSALKLGNSSGDIALKSKNQAFQRIIDIAEKASKSNVSVLLLGESGVGKEVFARFIHKNSQRNEQPFVAVNCHALSDNILESELFGHMKGSFTGALEDRIGRFEAADGGTLFLDEVAEMTLSTQVKLLRALENKQIERIGSNQSIDVDFRLISATNKDINKLMEDELFREDFYYRISPIVINIPPLRERKEDLEDLIEIFIKDMSNDMKKKITHIEPEVMDYLIDHEYPGNIRELKNIIERLVALAENGIVSFSNIMVKRKKAESGNSTLKEIRSVAEKEHIESILLKTGFSMTKASNLLGISRRQLFNKIKEYEIENGKLTSG
jgi:DNA-binding NtrC family response regulator